MRTRAPTTPGLRDERGSASIEMVILAPAFGMLLALLVMGGRLAMAEQSVQSAASAAARAASIERGDDSRERGLEAAQTYLTEQGLECSSFDVQVDASAKETDPGVEGQFVRATVSCDVDLTGLGLPGGTGTSTVSADAASPLDTYRER